MKYYTRAKNSVFNLGYHITFCPKYRKPFLMRINLKMITHIFHVCAIKVNGIIENMEIMPDHVHIFLRLKNTNLPISKIIQTIKGYSSFAIRSKFIWMKKYKALWSSGYFAESVGNMSESVIKRYIKNQKTNMKSDYKYKKMINKDLNGKLDYIQHGEKEKDRSNDCRQRMQDLQSYKNSPVQFKVSEKICKYSNHKLPNVAFKEHI
jgi:putative transposase